MCDLETQKKLDNAQFDRVVIKSGNHEIRKDQQLKLYQSVFRVLENEGLFINLGFVFENQDERDEFAELTRLKDKLAGMIAAYENRFFCIRDEFYGYLSKAGFTDVRAVLRFHYEINTETAIFD